MCFLCSESRVSVCAAQVHREVLASESFLFTPVKYAVTLKALGIFNKFKKIYPGRLGIWINVLKLNTRKLSLSY